MLISQGTIFPQEAFQKWGFVLCNGFFLVKSTKQTRQLFKAAVYEIKGSGSDQKGLNNALLKSNLDWQINDTYTFSEENNTLLCSNTIIGGQSQDLRVGLLPFKKFVRTTQAPTSDTYVYHPPSPKIASSKKKIFKRMNCWFLE